MKKIIVLLLICMCLTSKGLIIFPKLTYALEETKKELQQNSAEKPKEQPKKFIKWVDFNASYAVIKCAYDLNIKAKKAGLDFPVIKSLAYVTSKNGNSFNSSRDTKTLYKLYEEVKKGTKIEDLAANHKYYKHYEEIYTAVFSEFFGEDGKLKAYHPIAKGYSWRASDDFGNSRSYGFKRRHLGHDIWGSVGTPIMAIEGGTITELGWNKYGGWRIGIRSHDTKRYYYYAHLRKNKPYAEGIKKGDTVTAGQHIGYLGVTGYSNKENVNMNTSPHLHLGLQLIFDKSQEDGNGEIWIDLFALTRLLSLNRKAVVKTPAPAPTPKETAPAV